MLSRGSIPKKNFKKEKRKERKEKKKKVFQFLNKHKARVQTVSNPPTLQNYVHKRTPKEKKQNLYIKSNRRAQRG